MTNKFTLSKPGSPLVLRLFALGVLAVGVVGLMIGEMGPFEAGRLYLVAVGMYLIAPVEKLPKQSRRLRLLLGRPRYLVGVSSLTIAIAAVLLQFLAEILQRTSTS